MRDFLDDFGVPLVLLGFLILAAVALFAWCYESPEQIDRRQDSMCQSYGAKPGADSYIQCRATLAGREQAQQEIMAVSAMSGAALGLSLGSTSGRR